MNYSVSKSASRDLHGLWVTVVLCWLSVNNQGESVVYKERYFIFSETGILHLTWASAYAMLSVSNCLGYNTQKQFLFCPLNIWYYKVMAWKQGLHNVAGEIIVPKRCLPFNLKSLSICCPTWQRGDSDASCLILKRFFWVFRQIKCDNRAFQMHKKEAEMLFSEWCGIRQNQPSTASCAVRRGQRTKAFGQNLAVGKRRKQIFGLAWWLSWLIFPL